LKLATFQFSKTFVDTNTNVRASAIKTTFLICFGITYSFSSPKVMFENPLNVNITKIKKMSKKAKAKQLLPNNRVNNFTYFFNQPNNAFTVISRLVS
jgi:hypothetical protein